MQNPSGIKGITLWLSPHPFAFFTTRDLQTHGLKFQVRHLHVEHVAVLAISWPEELLKCVRLACSYKGVACHTAQNGEVNHFISFHLTYLFGRRVVWLKIYSLLFKNIV